MEVVRVQVPNHLMDEFLGTMEDFFHPSRFSFQQGDFRTTVTLEPTDSQEESLFNRMHSLFLQLEDQ